MKWLLGFVGVILLLAWLVRREKTRSADVALASRTSEPLPLVPEVHTPPQPDSRHESTTGTDTLNEQLAATPSSAVIFDMFKPPLESYGEKRLSKAYWAVVGELQGDGLTAEMLNDLRFPFISGLGHSRKAGELLATALRSVNWDWPRWQSFAKREGHDTVSDVLEWLGEQDLRALLQRELKDDLVALAASFNIEIRKSMVKMDMIDRLMEVPVEKIEPWINEAKKRARKTALWDVHKKMGQFVASRVSRLAYEEFRYEQICDPDLLRLNPYWKFICSESFPGKASKKCRDLDQVVLPAEEAMKVFPKLPCKRLDCHCRVATERRHETVASLTPNNS